MAYDEQSFLNGLAAGLTVTGGSKIGAGVLPDGWSQVMYRVRVKAGEDVYLGRHGLVHVDWGDGLVGNSHHIYQKAGEYTINVLTNNSVDYIAEFPVASYENNVRHTELLYEVSITGTGIRRLNDHCFIEYTNLTTVALPESLTEIGSLAFLRCTSLSSITIPDNVTTIQYAAFSGCSSLTNINIPPLLREIGVDIFHNCTNLSSITIPDSVSIIHAGAFANTGIREIVIPGNVEIITSEHLAGGAFAGCKYLTSVIMQEGVRLVGAVYDETGALGPPSNVSYGGVFYGCSRLQSVILPLSLEYMQFDAFAFYTYESLPNLHIYYAGSEGQLHRITRRSYAESSIFRGFPIVHYNSAGPNA